MSARVSGRVFRILVAAVLTGYVLFRSDPASVGDALAGADLRYIALACALTLLDRALMAWRWIGLLCIVEARRRPPFGRLMEIFFVSTFLGTFLPASVGGDAVRAYRLSKERVTGGDAVASVFMDRMLGVASLLIVAVPGVLLARSLAANAAVWSALAVTAAACGAAVLLIFSTHAAALASRMISAVPVPALQRAGRAVLESVRRYAHFRPRLATVLAASIGVQLLRIAQAYALGAGLGITAGPSLYFAFIPLILLVMLLPVTINGLGTSQAAFVWSFGSAGVANATAFALSILFVGLQIVGNLPGAFLYAFKGLPAADRGRAMERS